MLLKKGKYYARLKYRVGYEVYYMNNGEIKGETGMKEYHVLEEVIEVMKVINTLYNQNLQEITEFLKKHAGKVGENQAVKDLQKAMNMLNKGKKDSPIKEKQPLKEDGELGEKTYGSLIFVFKNYTPRLINKFIRRAAINNAIFDTKNNNNVNTEKKVDKIYENLKTDKEKAI